MLTAINPFVDYTLSLSPQFSTRLKKDIKPRDDN